MLNLILHPDVVVGEFARDHGTLVYGLLFLIVFMETGLVVTPFLPGDSLLFAAGALAAGHPPALNIIYLPFIFFFAALCGDNCNYWLGRTIGRKAFGNPNSKILNPNHLEKTEVFFLKHGGKAVIIARFVPIVRTFSPFVSGMGNMHWPRFLLYSVSGALLWVALGVGAGYLFGNIPFVQKNFSLVVLAIVVISLLPVLVEWLRHRNDRDTDTGPASDASQS